MALAWHTAGFVRWGDKRLPKLDGYLLKEAAVAHPDIWRHNLAIARVWASRGVGKIGTLH